MITAIGENKKPITRIVLSAVEALSKYLYKVEVPAISLAKVLQITQTLSMNSNLFGLFDQHNSGNWNILNSLSL